MMMLKWTTYDGTEATLPNEGVGVLTETFRGSLLIVMADHDEMEWVTEDDFLAGINVGDQWFPIPTQAQCEALMAVVEALEFYARRAT